MSLWTAGRSYSFLGLTRGFTFGLCAGILNPFYLFAEVFRILFLFVTPSFTPDRIPKVLAFSFWAIFLVMTIEAIGGEKALASGVFTFFFIVSLIKCIKPINIDQEVLSDYYDQGRKGEVEPKEEELSF